MIDPGAILDSLPVAIFALEREGSVEPRNPLAASMAGTGRGAGTLVELLGLTLRDGTAVAACPLRAGLDSGTELAGARFAAGSPGGRKRDVRVSTRLRRDAAGAVASVVAVVSDDTAGPLDAESIDGARLAAIVASSNDAIISKTLDGRITSWNESAARIFGYTAEEMIGESILRVIPPELHGEEAEILDRLRRGERIEHFDTVRMGKAGRRLDISLAISPLRNSAGAVVGASKIARDISARKRAEALQAQLFDELTHRVNNSLATMQSIAALSLAGSGDPASFVASFSRRLRALGVAHDRIVRAKMQGADLRELVRAIVPGEARVSGPDVLLDQRLVVPLALALSELATEAGDGRPAPVETSIGWRVGDEAALEVEWRTVAEEAGDTVRGPGFAVIQRVLEGIDGSVRAERRGTGFTARLTLPLPKDSERRHAVAALVAARTQGVQRVLVVEDEALIAMDMEAQLIAAGWDVVGPAGTIDEALALIEGTPFDAALVDANVRGRPVGEIAEALSARGIPFAFATGYGRSALPVGFREERLLSKPFAPDDLIEVVTQMLAGHGAAGVIPPAAR